MIEETRNTEQQEPTTHPEDNGASGEKLFTQEDVNRIVSERLARERAAKPAPDAEREQALNAREAKLSCREYIAEKKYPAELLEVLDTTNADKFKAAADKLIEKLPGVMRDPAAIPRPTGRYVNIGGAVPSGGNNTDRDDIAAAFKPKFNF